MTVNRKIAVITGASAGVGRETARLFAKHGYDLALLARGDAGLHAAAREVEGFGRRCLVIPTDVADFSQVDHAATRVELELGPIDVWINNAMTTVFSPFADVAPEDFERAVHVTFLGQVWGTKAALERMKPRDRGAVINVGSALAFVGIPLQAAYCASKFACRGFFEATRAELLHDRSRVRLSMVHLPAMNTPQFDWCETTMDKHPQPVPPIYQPEVAAQAIFDTAVDGKRSRIVGSWNKMLVVMDSFFPGLGNHYASIGAWSSQMTKQPIKEDRPSNLRRAVDEENDYGGHGIFDDKARGVKDPSFLVTLPKVAFLYLRACQLTVAEFAAVRKRRARVGGPRSSAHDGHGPSNESNGARSLPRDVSALARSAIAADGKEGQRPPHDNAGLTSDDQRSESTSLDVLRNEDRELLAIFRAIDEHRGEAVEERYAYGNLAKEALRHLAIRQASLMNVAESISNLPGLGEIGSRMISRGTERRSAIDEAVEMARAVQPVALNEGQNFSDTFEPLMATVAAEIRWELFEALPAIERALADAEPSKLFRSARYVRRHAPTHLSTKGPRWYEQAPVVSRLKTAYEHLNDFPRAARDWRSS